MAKRSFGIKMPCSYWRQPPILIYPQHGIASMAKAVLTTKVTAPITALMMSLMSSLLPGSTSESEAQTF